MKSVFVKTLLTVLSAALISACSCPSDNNQKNYVFAKKTLIKDLALREDALVFGHKNPDTDSTVGAIAYSNFLNKNAVDAKAATQGKISKETEFVLNKFNLQIPDTVDSVKGRDVYLVDFSDIEQAPKDIKKANIRGIVDHHRLGNITTDTPIEVWMQPYGSTNTIIKHIYDVHGIEIDKNIAGAMLCAILSDTLILQSPTTTEYDIAAVEALSKIAEIDDVNKLGEELFKAKSDLNGPAKDIVLNDFKDYVFGKNKVGIASIEVLSFDLISDDLQKDIQTELEKLKADKRHTVILMITDITKLGSKLVVLSDEKEKVLKAFNLMKSKDMFLDGVVSRKKQIVPVISQALN